MMNTNEMQKAENKTLNNVGCFGLMISVVLYTLAFIFGAFSGNGDQVSVLQAVEKILKIFSFSTRIWYYYLSSLAQGITYIVIMILLIKSSVVSIKYLTNKEMTGSTKTVKLGNEFSDVYKNCVIYVFVSCMLNQTAFSSSIAIFLMLGWIIITASSLLGILSVNKAVNWKYLVSDTVYSLVKGIILAIFGYFVARPVVFGFVEGVRILFTVADFSNSLVALELVYRTLIIEIIYILLIFDFFTVIDKELFYNTTYLKQSWTHLIVISSIYLSLELFMVIALSGGNINVFEQLGTYFQAIRNAGLPLLLAAIAGRVSCSFPEFSMAKPKKSVTVKKEKADIVSIYEPTVDIDEETLE